MTSRHPGNGSDRVEPWAAALRAVSGRATGAALPGGARLTVNFHPDRTVRGAMVIDHLARDGWYRSQFVTRISNGGLTAHPGGSRWRWEQRLFEGAYDEARPDQRPIYGSLDRGAAPLGGAPRFGSAFLVLRPDVLQRSTFCFPDSVFQPEDVGTAQRFHLFRLADEFAAVPRTEAEERTDGGVLDSYVEAHIHGGLEVRRDVAEVVLDPAFQGGAVEGASSQLGVPVRWHEGRMLEVDELTRHPEFRGAEVVDLGRRLARDGLLDAAIIGEHAEREERQLLKMLWHCIARFGSPRR